MKIVFVSDAIYPYHKGGKEKRLFELSTRLAKRGHDVHIYTMHWWNSPDGAQYEQGVYLHAISKLYDLYVLDRRSITQGILFGLACLKLLRVNFDILDVDHMPFFPILSAWIVCKLRGRRLYGTWHEAISHQEWMAYMGWGGLMGELIERLCVRLPYQITAASAHTKQRLNSIHGRHTGISFVPSGIDKSYLRTVHPIAKHCDVLYVGRLVKDKHIDKLILAIHLLAQAQPDIRCIIIGDGIEKTRLEQLTRQQQVQRNVTFLKPLPEARDVYAYMKAAKVFCSPSVREGFGIVSLEALGCGTPVVTIDSPSNAARYLIEDGVNGSIVLLDPNALAAALAHWVTATIKPEMTHTLDEYDWDVLAEQQEAVYLA